MLHNSMFGFLVTTFFRFSFLCLALFFSGCGTTGSKFKNYALSSGSEIAFSGFPYNQYNGSPAINSADYIPAGGSMEVETHQDTQFEYNWVLDYRWRVARFVYTGLTATPITMYLANNPTMRGGNGLRDCSQFFCNSIRYATLHWWDEVVIDSYTAKYTPSIGWVVGLMSGESKEEAGRFDFFLEYAMSIRHYSFKHDIYAGKDCYGCINTSYIKESVDLGSGVAWRQAIKIGGGHFSGIFWVELAGLQAVSMGIGMRISGNLLGDYDPNND